MAQTRDYRMTRHWKPENRATLEPDSNAAVSCSAAFQLP
jgi:hypothetical protein